jgi:hypothetical protein
MRSWSISDFTRRITFAAVVQYAGSEPKLDTLLATARLLFSAL